MQPRQNKPLPDFGEPLDKKLLLGFAAITNADVASAVQWFDEYASPEWQGVLDAKPIGKKKR